MNKILFAITLLASMTSFATSLSLRQGDVLTTKVDLSAANAYEAWGRDANGSSEFKTFYGLDFSCFNEDGLHSYTQCSDTKKDICRLDIERKEQSFVISAGETFKINEIRETIDSGSSISIPAQKAYYVVSLGSLGTGTIRTITCSRKGSSRKISAKKVNKMLSVIFN